MFAQQFTKWIRSQTRSHRLSVSLWPVKAKRNICLRLFFFLILIDAWVRFCLIFHTTPEELGLEKKSFSFCRRILCCISLCPRSLNFLSAGFITSCQLLLNMFWKSKMKPSFGSSHKLCTEQRMVCSCCLSTAILQGTVAGHLVFISALKLWLLQTVQNLSACLHRQHVCLVTGWISPTARWLGPLLLCSTSVTPWSRFTQSKMQDRSAPSLWFSVCVSRT